MIPVGDSKANWALVGFSTGVALDLNNHSCSLHGTTQRRPDLRVPLQSLHCSPDFLGCFAADVIDVDESLDRYPAQVAKAVIPGIAKGSHNYRPEVELVSSHGCVVVEPDVHPRRPFRTSKSGALTETHFLPCQEANLVRLLKPLQKRLLQRASRAYNLLTRVRPDAAGGVHHKTLCNLEIDFTWHLKPFSSRAARIRLSRSEQNQGVAASEVARSTRPFGSGSLPSNGFRSVNAWIEPHPWFIQFGLFCKNGPRQDLIGRIALCLQRYGEDGLPSEWYRFLSGCTRRP